MTERTSRIIVGVEAIAICFPLTVLFLFGVLPSNVYFWKNANDFLTSGTALSTIFLSLFCAWFLLVTFIFRGTLSLRLRSQYWWALPFLSAFLAVATAIKLKVSSVIEPSALNLFGWGLPLLIPLAHLCYERWLRKANT